MIYNVDNIKELCCEETNYWKIINFFKKFSKEWFDKNDIYCEGHHIYPKKELEIELDLIVYLPIKYHFLVHYYRALNSKSKKIKKINFNACRIMLGNMKLLDNEIKFDSKIYLTKEINSIYNWQSKKVINLETKEIFDTMASAIKKCKIQKCHLSKICNFPEEYYKNSCYKTRYFAFYDETKSEKYWDDLYNKYKNIPNRKKTSWSKENIIKRAKKVTGKHFVQKKSKKVINLETKEIFNSTTEAERFLSISRHKILKSCRENRKIISKNKIINFRYIL